MCKLFTPSDLRDKRDGELSALFRRIAGEMAQTAPDSPERQAAQTSLENIRLELSARRHRRPKPPGG
ncbi:hypothetical protein [Endothiovibrio diazotrophicus]